MADSVSSLDPGSCTQACNTVQQNPGKREKVEEAVAQFGRSLQFAVKELRDDRDIVMQAIAQDGWALQFAPEDLRGDDEVVLRATAQNYRALQFASEGLRGDAEFMLRATREDYRALQYASEEVRADRDSMLQAMALDGRALQFISQALRQDREVVLQAVTRSGKALQFASEELRGDREVVSRAVADSSSALLHASEELRSNRGIWLQALGRSDASAAPNRDKQTPEEVAAGCGHAEVIETAVKARKDPDEGNRSYFLCLQDIIGPRPERSTVHDELSKHKDWHEDWQVALRHAQSLQREGKLPWNLDETEVALLRLWTHKMSHLDPEESFYRVAVNVLRNKKHKSGIVATLFKLCSAYVKLARSPSEYPNVFYSARSRQFFDSGLGKRWVSMAPVSWTPNKDVAKEFTRSVKDLVIMVLYGRPPDDVFHMPFDISQFSMYKDEREVITPFCTALLNTSEEYTEEGVTFANVECSFSPQLLSELIRPHQDVWEAVRSGDEATLRDWLTEYPVMDLEYEHPKFKCSILYSACRFGHLKCAKALVESCAQINSQLSSTKSTALHAAAFFGHPHLVELLLKNLADPTLQNINNLTPVEEAAENTKHLVEGSAAPVIAASKGLKLVVDATELWYGDLSGFILGLQAIVGTPLLTLEEEWKGRPSISWTNKYGSNTAGELWPEAKDHCKDQRLMKKQQARKANLTYDEVLSCALYTGDGFTPLNRWLRKLGRAVQESRRDEIAELRSRDVSFASTVLHIASAMQKLARVDDACPPLVRGIEGKLPDDFFVPDARGMVTLTEYGFVSTSRSTEVADGFGEGGLSVIVNIVTKAEDAFGFHNGVDLEWLTMNPGEMETLFPPGTVFDVVNRRREGLRIFLTVRPTFLF